MKNAAIPVRHKKISNRQARRHAQMAIEYGMKSGLILLAVLAQRGGEMTVTQGTINQVTSRLDTLRWEIAPSKIKGEFIVRTIEESTDGAGITGTDVAPADDVRDGQTRKASGGGAGGSGGDGTGVGVAAVPAESPNQRRSDLSIRRVDDAVAPEGGD